MCSHRPPSAATDLTLHVGISFQPASMERDLRSGAHQSVCQTPVRHRNRPTWPVTSKCYPLLSGPRRQGCALIVSVGLCTTVASFVAHDAMCRAAHQLAQMVANPMVEEDTTSNSSGLAGRVVSRGHPENHGIGRLPGPPARHLRWTLAQAISLVDTGFRLDSYCVTR